MPSEDLKPMMDRWPFDPEQAVRMVRGRDGRRKLQVRLPLGIEQYELDGRPDGATPKGHGSLLAYWERRARSYRRRYGSELGFVVPTKACDDLREESLLYYYRYILLFQIGEYGRCARDTWRNIRCLDLMGRYGARPEDRSSMEQYRPYILRMYRASRALLAMRRSQYEIALRELEAGMQAIRSLPGREEAGFGFERRRSLTFLKQLSREIRKQMPVSPQERLERRLRKAVAREDYERAAELRDRIAAIERRKAARRRG